MELNLQTPVFIGVCGHGKQVYKTRIKQDRKQANKQEERTAALPPCSCVRFFLKKSLFKNEKTITFPYPCSCRASDTAVVPVETDPGF